MQNIENIMKFISECEKLKTTWRFLESNDENMKESSADHSWRLAIMILLIWKEVWVDIDLFKTVKIALVHDLAEAVTWDLDAYHHRNNENLKIKKEQDELNAMIYLKDIIWWELWNEIFLYWQEYEEWVTKEAMFVKALDKIETLIKICDKREYAYEGLDFIAHYADKHIAKVPELEPILVVTKKRLKKTFKKWWFEWKKEYDN